MSEGRRIDNLPAEAWTPEVEAIFPILVPPGAAVKGSDFNSLLVLAHHPELADPFLRFNVAVGRGVVLSARLRELAILRVSWRRSCQYEWIHHLFGGATAGLTVAHFQALTADSMADLFTDEERAVLLATDELCANGAVSDPTWTALCAHLDTRQTLELVFAVGCFLTVAALLNTARVEVEPAFLASAAANGWPLLV